MTYEAMSSGLPLIATENSGSVMRDGIDGFLVPIRDSKALGEKILYFYEQREEMRRMGANAVEQVKQYSWERYQERLIDTYRSLFAL